MVFGTQFCTYTNVKNSAFCCSPQIFRDTVLFNFSVPQIYYCAPYFYEHIQRLFILELPTIQISVIGII